MNDTTSDNAKETLKIDKKFFDISENPFETLIKWADENEISADKFPRDKENLKNLKELYLSDLECLPNEFVNLQSLESLYLEGNFFQKLPKVTNKLKNLKECNIIKTDLD